ncbi:hypothetical protein DEO72_LG9g2010 [Vigna unguiculata]|uniref:Uncharacterized protein n=1 Tax=Vigna unguiculata TaxID=3917 RepID=A0A4D6N4G8_VIGUN|nr:hypothetical protein DEO72_LG9g2010 [Vigna unguiculata]
MLVSSAIPSHNSKDAIPSHNSRNAMCLPYIPSHNSRDIVPSHNSRDIVPSHNSKNTPASRSLRYHPKPCRTHTSKVYNHSALALSPDATLEPPGESQFQTTWGTFLPPGARRLKVY